MAATNHTSLAINGVEIPVHATVVAAAEDTNVVNVVIQLYANEVTLKALENLATIEVWISDSAAGIGLAATAPSSGFAIGTDGDIMALVVSGKYALVRCEVDGSIDLDVTEAGTDTFYVAVRLPTGRIIVSNALTFAA